MVTYNDIGAPVNGSMRDLRLTLKQFFRTHPPKVERADHNVALSPYGLNVQPHPFHRCRIGNRIDRGRQAADLRAVIHIGSHHTNERTASLGRGGPCLPRAVAVLLQAGKTDPILFHACRTAGLSQIRAEAGGQYAAFL